MKKYKSLFISIGLFLGSAFIAGALSEALPVLSIPSKVTKTVYQQPGSSTNTVTAIVPEYEISWIKPRTQGSISAVGFVDSDGVGCTLITGNDGVLAGKSVVCE